MPVFTSVEIVLVICLFISACNSQTTLEQKNTLSNDFDKSMPFYYKMPKGVSEIDTSPTYSHNEQKILLTGIIYQNETKTPANNVLLYYYQTDSNGIYTTIANENRNMPKNSLGQTHGYIRGWIRTNEQGKYHIYTTLPGSYPSRNEPAHIHVTIKEEHADVPYYIDDFVFDNDKLLTTERRREMENRGGSGVIRFVQQDSLWIGERNIYLGLNIPKYPKNDSLLPNSGKNIGENILSFKPFHAFGEDKGTKTCPICKYGWYHGILYFVGNKVNWNDVEDWLIFLDNESQHRKKYLKVYFIYGNEQHYTKDKRMKELNIVGRELGLKNIALTFVPSFADKASEIYLNDINPNVENTFLIYKRSTVIDKFIDLKPTKHNFEQIIKLLDHSANEYFKLARPKLK